MALPSEIQMMFSNPHINGWCLWALLGAAILIVFGLPMARWVTFIPENPSDWKRSYWPELRTLRFWAVLLVLHIVVQVWYTADRVHYYGVKLDLPWGEYFPYYVLFILSIGFEVWLLVVLIGHILRARVETPASER